MVVFVTIFFQPKNKEIMQRYFKTLRSISPSPRLRIKFLECVRNYVSRSILDDLDIFQPSDYIDQATSRLIFRQFWDFSRGAN
jgi:hypothetical protein